MKVYFKTSVIGEVIKQYTHEFNGMKLTDILTPNGATTIRTPTKKDKFWSIK